MKSLTASLCASNRSVHDVAKAFLWLTTAIFGHAANVEIDIIKTLSEKVWWKPMQVCDLVTKQTQKFIRESIIRQCEGLRDFGCLSIQKLLLYSFILFLFL